MRHCTSLMASKRIPEETNNNHIIVILYVPTFLNLSQGLASSRTELYRYNYVLNPTRIYPNFQTSYCHSFVCDFHGWRLDREERVLETENEMCLLAETAVLSSSGLDRAKVTNAVPPFSGYDVFTLVKERVAVDGQNEINHSFLFI